MQYELIELNSEGGEDQMIATGSFSKMEKLLESVMADVENEEAETVYPNYRIQPAKSNGKPWTHWGSK